jgi:hypothetical protein
MRRLIGCLAAAALASACTSAPATAAPADVASAHTALHVYKGYLTAVIRGERGSVKQADTFIASIAAKCPNVLAPLNQVPPSSLNQSALTAFGVELGADIDLALFKSDRRAVRRLSAKVGRLHWSSRSRAKSIKRSLAAQRHAFALAPSDLCADAQALAASNGQSVAPGTAPFNASFARAVSAGGLGAVTGAVKRFHSPGDRATMRAVSKLAKRAKAQLIAAGEAELPKLVATLGLSTS